MMATSLITSMLAVMRARLRPCARRCGSPSLPPRCEENGHGQAAQAWALAGWRLACVGLRGGGCVVAVRLAVAMLAATGADRDRRWQDWLGVVWVMGAPHSRLQGRRGGCKVMARVPVADESLPLLTSRWLRQGEQGICGLA